MKVITQAEYDAFRDA
jgi:phospholipid-transporting ATPase